MTRKFALAAVALVLATGLCLAADMTAESAKPWQSRLRTSPQTVKSPYVPPARLDPKAWHINESFEGSFPPAGWTVQNVAGASYAWVQSSSSVHSGSYSAFIHYDCSGYSEDWLITPQVTIQSNDTLYFWLDIDDFGWPPDTTKVMISTTDNQPASFTTVLWQQWDGGGYVDAWTEYAVDLSAYAGQSVYLAFRHNNNCGDGVFVDDVRIGHEQTLSHNLAMQSIDVPASSPIEPGTPFTPTVTVSNPGGNPEVDFWVYYSIDDGSKTEVYSASQQVSDTLQPAATAQFTFSDFTPAAGSYTVTAWVELAGDEYPGDDTLSASYTSSYWFWEAWTPYSEGWAAAAMTGYNGLFYMFGGKNFAASTPTNQIAIYDHATTTWSYSSATMSTINYYSYAVPARGKIFNIGGSSSWPTPLTNVDCYSPDGDSLNPRSPLPVATCEHVAGVWRDSLIYVLGGGNWSMAPITNVQIYDIVNDTWTAGTPLPVGVGTQAGAILGDTIVMTCGYASAQIATTYIGVIDTTNPTSITWTTGPDYPAGALYRVMGGYIGDADNHELLVTGGQPGLVLTTYSYSTGSKGWMPRPDKITAATNSRGGGQVGEYFVVCGGYTGSAYSPNTDALHVWWAPTVVPPEIVWTSPYQDETGIRRKQPVVLAFSEPMDPATMDGYTSPNVGSVDLIWNAAFDTLTLTPEGLWDYNTEYLMIVTAGANPGGVNLAKLPDTLRFTTWLAPDVIQDQMATPGQAGASQVFGDYLAYTCYLADDINLTGMDSVKVTAVEVVGGAWNGHTWHPMDSLYLSFTTDSTDFPAWSQEIWGGDLVPGTFDDVYNGVANNTLIMYLDPPVMLANGKSWMMCAPYMNYAAKDGQWGWAQNDPAAYNASQPAWRNPGGGFGNGSNWQRASVTGLDGDLVWRALGYAYPTGVAGGPTGATKAVFALMPNFPNPISGRTTFSFSLPKASDYSLKVYNIAGQMVQSFTGKGQAGANSVNWNAQKTGAGVYFFQLNAGGQSATRKLVVVK
jgi:hypothetical protein